MELFDLLRKSTVKVSTSKGMSTGTATFVFPNHLLTAAHVIHDAGDGAMVETYDHRQLRNLRTIAQLPTEKVPGQNWPLPDLAVIRIDDEGLDEHMCVELTDAMPQDGEFWADGFVRGLEGKAVQDRARLSFDSARREGETTVLQFSGNIQDGMSGAPVLDLRSGRVVGIVKADRDWRRSAGGFAIGGETLRERLPGPWAKNIEFHSGHSPWRVAARAGQIPTIDREAIERYLSTTRDALSQSPLLPSGITRDDLRQPVRLRSKRFEKAPGSAEALTIEADSTSLSGLSKAFIWDPLRSPWRDVAVVAGPGMGKSWLLAYHVSAIADQQLKQLADQPELRDEVEIPVWVAAAGLARQLEPVPTKDEAMDALAKAVHLTTGVLSPSEISVLMTVAAGRENLVLCVDGLDEVPSDLRSRLSTALSLLEPDVRQLIITTREAAGQLLADLFPRDFEEFSIEGFTEGDAKLFIESWHRHNPGAAAKVRRAIRESNHLKPLSRVPLLLGFVCRLVGSDDNAELPETRSRLYHEVALDLLSGRWRDTAARRADGEISDPHLRLKLLSRAVGGLVTGWRTRPEEFVWSDINARLREDPDYDLVRQGAISRWQNRQRTSPMDREPDDAPDDVVLWEFEHDGFLDKMISRDRRPSVRFTHLVFAELCIALSLASADSEERAARLALHRWFDDEWNDIIPIACGVADDPRGLLEEIASATSDPWMVQAVLEARSMAEAPNAVSPAAVESLVERLVEATNSNLRTDLGRCLKALEVLITSDVSGARARIRELVESGGIRREEDAVALAVILCRVGDLYGIERCVEMAEDEKLSLTTRTQARIALCVTNDPELVSKAVRPVTDLSGSPRESIISALVHGDAASVEVAVELIKDESLDVDLQAAVAVGLIYAGSAEAAQILLDDPRSSRTMRARAVTALLRTGHSVPPGEAETLAADPNVVPEDRLELIHALVLRGDRSVLEAGAELAVNFRLDYQKRQELAQTMLAIGPLGRSVLAKEAFADWRSSASRVRALLAMLERRDEEAADVAAVIVGKRSEIVWVRCALAEGLLQWMPNRVEQAPVLELVDHSELSGSELSGSWEALLIQMLAAGIPQLAAAAETRVKLALGLERPAEDGDPIPLPAETQASVLCGRLGAGGPGGLALLTELIGSAEMDLDTRIQAAKVLAQASGSAAQSLEGFLDDKSVPVPIRERLVVMFAILGATVVFERLLDLLPGSEPAYSALHVLLSGADTELELVKRGVEAGAAARAALSGAPVTEWELEFEELARSVPFESRSDVEEKMRLGWIDMTLRSRIFGRLLSLLLPVEMKELHQVGNFVDNEATRNWLATRIPSYREIAAAEVERLKQEIGADPEILPSPAVRTDALGVVETTAMVLREWVRAGTEGEWDRGFVLLLENEPLFRSDVAFALFGVALAIEDTWPIMSAHRYMLEALRGETPRELVDAVRNDSALLDRLKTLVDANRGMDALRCAGIGCARYPENAALHFYAAVGAELAGVPTVAEELMEKSATHATVKQAMEGRESLLRWEEQHKMDPERVARLREILAAALKSEEDQDDEDEIPGDGPDGNGPDGDQPGEDPDATPVGAAG